MEGIDRCTVQYIYGARSTETYPCRCRCGRKEKGKAVEDYTLADQVLTLEETGRPGSYRDTHTHTPMEDVFAGPGRPRPPSSSRSTATSPSREGHG